MNRYIEGKNQRSLVSRPELRKKEPSATCDLSGRWENIKDSLHGLCMQLSCAQLCTSFSTLRPSSGDAVTFDTKSHVDDLCRRAFCPVLLSLDQSEVRDMGPQCSQVSPRRA